MNFRKLIRGRTRNRRAAAMERRQWFLGALVTVAVALAWWAGWLDRIEAPLLDRSQNFFYERTDEPSDRIALVSIDDRSLETIGRWPWDREKLASIINELTRAQTSVVALDLLLDDASPERLVKRPNPLTWEFRPDEKITKEMLEPIRESVDDDRILSRAIYDHGRVILAGKFTFVESAGGVNESKLPLDAVFQALERDVEVQKAVKLMEQTPAEWRTSSDAEQRRKFKDAEDAALLSLRTAIGGLDAGGTTRGNEFDLARLTLDRVLALKTSALNSSLELSVAGRPWAKSVSPSPPVAVLASAAARVANVTFNSTDPDGVTRKIPLWVNHRAHLWPTLGLAAVMEYRSIAPEDVTIEGDDIVFKLRDSATSRFRMIKSRFQRGSEIDGVSYVTWPRGRFRMAEQVGQAVSAAIERYRDNEDQLRLVFGVGGVQHPAGSTDPARLVPQIARTPSSIMGWEWQLFDASEARTQIISAGRLYEPAIQAVRIEENIIELGATIEKALSLRDTRFMSPEAQERSRIIIRQLLQIAVTDADKAKLETSDPEWLKLHLEKVSFETSDPEWLKLLDELRAITSDGQKQAAEWLASSGMVEEMLAIAKKSDDHARGLVGVDLFEPFKAAVAQGEAEATAFLMNHSQVWTVANFKKVLGSDPGDARAAEDINRMDTISRAVFAVPRLHTQIDRSITTIAQIRRELVNLLRGRIVILGFTATGTDSDVVITPIDPRTPGPMVHVAVANAFLRDLNRVPWPLWADFLVIGIMGITGTWFGVRLDVFTGPLAVFGLVLAWFAIGGAFFWDNRLSIVAMAGPMLAAFAGWVAVLLHRLLVEQRGRKVTEERFKSYVSPAVVDILVNNPELGTMRPAMREMTVMFTDVADFTTTSERLGPELLAKCLSKYLKEMTEILQKNRGTLDKYLGDGIMAFYNAPIDDPEHARHACSTAVAMLARLDELNDAGAFEEAGRLKVRIGICTGQCMVGDFGNPPRNSNYTLLGDTANFAARLEGANKFFGSRILATQRTRDHAGPDVRWRTIGKVFVKGKKEADWLYELVGRLEPHGPATEEWIALTDEAVKDYAAGNFEACTEKFDMLARRFGDAKLAEIYGDAMAAWKSRPDFPAAFDGAIVLTEK